MPADRYGRDSSASTRLLLALAAVALAAVIGWFIWTVVLVSDPKVTSSIGGQDLGQTSVTFTYTVHTGKGVNLKDVRCIVSAQAKDFSIVGGPRVIIPTVDGNQTYTLRTSAHAVYVNWAGCTAPGQSNPR